MSEALTPERVRKMRDALRLELPDLVWQDVVPVFDMMEDILTDVDINALRQVVAGGEQRMRRSKSWHATVALVAIFDHHQIGVS